MDEHDVLIPDEYDEITLYKMGHLELLEFWCGDRIVRMDEEQLKFRIGIGIYVECPGWKI